MHAKNSLTVWLLASFKNRQLLVAPNGSALPLENVASWLIKPLIHSRSQGSTWGPPFFLP